jgi:L-lactate dehydrogenase (cytochrome)
MAIANATDFRAFARRRLPGLLFDYIDGGSYSEATLRANIDDFARLKLRQRVMRDMRSLDLGIELFGESLSMPLILAPVGLAGMYARRGEVQAARAAAAAGIPFCLSSMGLCDVEEVAAAGTPPWFQLYVLADRGYTIELLDRAWAAGSRVLMLTVDLPISRSRPRDIRSGFAGPRTWASEARKIADGLARPAWMWDVWLRGRPLQLGSMAAAMAGSSGAQFVANSFDRGVTWDDLTWVRQHWKGPIIVKGVLDPEDARLAVDAGASTLLVSNHGGRQLDSASSSIAMLPRIADAVGDRADLLLDGGVRSGLDILKALASGARACCIGRPWAYALAAQGEAGVARLLAMLKAELTAAMVLTGCNSIADAGPMLLDHRSTP